MTVTAYCRQSVLKVNYTKAEFPKCAPWIPRDARLVPMGTVDTHL